MRIFHLSDLHIGLKLINRDLREDQEYILDQIIQKAAEKVPDAIVIAGEDRKSTRLNSSHIL